MHSVLTDRQTFVYKSDIIVGAGDSVPRSVQLELDEGPRSHSSSKAPPTAAPAGTG